MFSAIEESADSLSTYLNDALTSETLGIELAKRAIMENDGSRLATFLKLLSWELEEDRESLVQLMRELGVRRNRVGVLAARFAEKLSRVRLRRSSPLRVLVDLESLHLRISGKLDTWNALASRVGHRVDGIDFDEVIRRTERQVDALERRRLAAAAEALAYRKGSTPARSGTPLVATTA